jgi:hypothetical protein
LGARRKALGNTCWRDQGQELGTGQGAAFEGFGPAVAVAEGDLSIFAGNDLLLPDHTAIQIASEMDQGLLAAADAFR